MRTAVTILGTRLWWRHAFLQSGDATHTEFIERFDRYASAKTGYGLKPSLLSAWERGEHAVSPGSVRRVSSCVPGDTAHVYLLIRLLQPKRLSAPGVSRLMKDYIVTRADGSRDWKFPNDAQLAKENRLPTLSAWDDSDHLVERGDFFGLLAILALFRAATAQSRYDDIRRHYANVYRALPAVVRLPWARPDVDLLLQCVEDVMHAARFFVFRHAIDWAIFRVQILTPAFVPKSCSWVRDKNIKPCLNEITDVIADDRVIGEPRPVPLLENVQPLAPYIVRPQPRLPPTPRQRVRLGVVLMQESKKPAPPNETSFDRMEKSDPSG